MNLKKFLKKLNIPTEIENNNVENIFFIFLFIFILICGSSYYEIVIALLISFLYCIVLTINFKYKNSRIMNVVKWMFFVLILVTLLASKTKYFGYFSNSNLEKKRIDSFNKHMSYALYHYSLRMYDESAIEFKKAANYSSEEDKFECNCWLLENYSRNYKNKSVSSLLLELDNSTARYNNSSTMNMYYPIIEMITFYNNEEWLKIYKLAERFEYMDEKCIYLFKILSLIKMDISNIDKDTFVDLVYNLHSFKSNIKNIKSVENLLLKDISIFLSKHNSPYSVVFYAELLNNGKSDFYNEFFSIIPKENNFFNIRFISADIYKYIQGACVDNYRLLNKDLKSIYKTKFNNLFMFLGLVNLFEIDNKVIDEINKIKSVDEELYNFIELEKNKYFFIKMKYQNFYGSKVFCEAKSYIVDTSNSQLKYENIDYFNSEYSLLMNKLFVVDYFNNKLLFEIIDGSGEILFLDLVDLFSKKCTSLIPNNVENHHVSNVSFDYTNTITYSTEVNNSYFGNSEKKAAGEVTLNINWEDLNVNYNIYYPDPALQLFFNNKEFSFITPIVNRIKKNVDQEVIDRIISCKEIVLYTKIQESYEHFMKTIDCKYSGLHLLYNEGNEQFHYFVFVKKNEKETVIIDFYEVKNNELISLFR